MGRRIVLLLVVFCTTFQLKATDQDADVLIYNKKELYLDLNLSPSPLQLYFSQNDMEYPFLPRRTSNWRGHVAVWEIAGERLWLNDIIVDSLRHDPSKYIETKDEIFDNKKVFAGWYSGVLACSRNENVIFGENDSVYLFYVEKGKVVSSGKFKDEYIKEGLNIAKEKGKTLLNEKDSLQELYQNFINYNSVTPPRDKLFYDKKECIIIGDSRMIFLHFSGGENPWPYRWQNLMQSGRPHCQWTIEKDSLFLKKVTLFNGLYSTKKGRETSIDLKELFEGNPNKELVFGSWISSVIVSCEGKFVKSENSFNKVFKVKQYCFLRVEKGIIIEKYTVSGEFDFTNNIDSKLKQLIIDSSFDHSKQVIKYF